jgi:excisionase family DNA binding protein
VSIAAEVVAALKNEGIVLAGDTRPMLNCRQVAARLGISERSVRAMFDEGVLPSVMVGPGGGSRRCLQADLDEYIGRQRLAREGGLRG